MTTLRVNVVKNDGTGQVIAFFPTSEEAVRYCEGMGLSVSVVDGQTLSHMWADVFLTHTVAPIVVKSADKSDKSDTCRNCANCECK
jgi:hypothetical protein